MREYVADVAILGAGPAGLAAAREIQRAGKTGLIIDDQPNAGGQIWRGGPAQADTARSRHALAILSADGVYYLPRHQLVAAMSPYHLLLEGPHSAAHVHTRQLILATGARERLLPFPGWTLPGVTGAGGLQALNKGGWPLAGKRVVLAGSGPLLLATAATLRRAGAKLSHVLEQTSFHQLARFTNHLLDTPSKLWQAIPLGLPLLGRYHPSSHVLAAHGQDRLETVLVQQGARQVTIPCDYLAVGFGLIPNTEAANLIGCQLAGQFVATDYKQRTSVPDVFAAGEITGIGGADKAIIEGRIAARTALNLPIPGSLIRQRLIQQHFVQQLATCFALNPALLTLAKPDTLMCRCEDVPLSELMPYTSWRDAKLQTRCGMGACQGRTCGPICHSVLGWETNSQRPPIFPARLSTLASLEDRPRQPQPHQEGAS
ncbi:FAD/NAD(P)-binding oxidoreductase [Chitinivorax sp. B]|uniref:NAD(P)/FAD-dependent oxidoreductase n=1 Tax=Chitinivorax sp. B TaxID=2502235 RepID=UPI0010F8083B|nr:FAD/NAD(P)-binding oxidoreductase [Chitinivorax sp. B]